MTPEKRSEIAKKGGQAISQNRKYMATIGRKGGQADRTRHNPKEQ